jgi:putative transposase
MPRYCLPVEGFFHVTSRGVGRMNIAHDDFDRVRWCALADATIARFGWTCHAYCFMNNHFHFVVEASLDRLSKGMWHLNGRYAERFNTRYVRNGHVFEARFAAKVIQGESHFEAAAHYVLNNPVRAHLCERAEDWPWSGGVLARL